MGPLGHAKFHANRCSKVGTRPPKWQKCPLFSKESPHRGEPFDRFLQLLGAFIRPTILQCFTFDAIRFTDYEVIAEKLRFGHLPRIFMCTL